MKERVWASYQNSKFKEFWLGLLLKRYQTTERSLNIFLAVASSGSIAVWAVWERFPQLWAGIIALSQLITAVKPYFPYAKYTRELNERYLLSQTLNIDYEKLWFRMTNQKLTEAQIAKEFFELRKRQNTTYTFSEETIIPDTPQLNDQASAKMAEYLETNHGIKIVLPFNGN